MVFISLSLCRLIVLGVVYRFNGDGMREANEPRYPGPYKPSCTTIDDGQRLESPDLKNREIRKTKATVTAQLTCAFIFAYAYTDFRMTRLT